MAGGDHGGLRVVFIRVRARRGCTGGQPRGASGTGSSAACGVGTSIGRVGVIGIGLGDQRQLVFGKALQIRRHLLRVVITIRRRLRHSGQSDGVQAQSLALRQVHARNLGRRLRVLLHVLEGNGQRGLAVEGSLARGQLVEHATGGVNIRTCVGGLAACLLGGEVLGGADDGGGLRHGRGAIAQRACDAEVHDLHRAGVGDHHVRGLDVAVNDARLVREVQRRADLGHDRRGIVQAHLPGVLDDVAQGFAVHALHDDVRHRTVLVRGLTRVVNGDDGGVVQLRGILSLAAEALQEGGVARQIGAHHLYRHIAAQQFIGSGVHVGHATSADLGTEAVSSAQGCAVSVHAFCSFVCFCS